MEDFDFPAARRRMVEYQLAARGITDERVLAAMGAVPRHEFILPTDWDEAYADHPVRIACGQTISQPYIVAYMTQLLAVEPGMKVLEIGTGCGYQTAVLAELGAKVHTVERHAPLAEAAAARLTSLDYAATVAFRTGDGSRGWSEAAPFDRILVTAVAPEVPPPLLAQISANGGRMVVPVGVARQRLVVIERHGEVYDTTRDIGVIFVKLIGEAGFSG